MRRLRQELLLEPIDETLQRVVRQLARAAIAVS
jgi:hypothetical protein